MHWLIFSFSSRLSRPSKKVNFPSVTVWYNEGYDISEIASSHSPFKCKCSGRNFVKELRL